MTAPRWQLKVTSGYLELVQVIRATCRPPIACAQAAYRSRAGSRAAHRPCPRWKRPVPASCASPCGLGPCSVHARELRAARRAATQQGLLFFLSARCSRRPRALVRTAPRAVAAAMAQGYSAVGGSFGLLGATHHIRNHDNRSHFPISYSSGFLSSVGDIATARSLVVCSRVGVFDVCGF